MVIHIMREMVVIEGSGTNSDHISPPIPPERNESPDNGVNWNVVGNNASQSHNGSTTRSGCVTNRPSRLVEEMGAAELSHAEKNYYSILADEEIACVGAGIGGGFSNTNELKVMKYKAAMASPEAKGWKEAVVEEHDRMVQHKVWKPVKRKDVPVGAKVITSTWAMKKKSNGVKRARLNGRGYEQVDGEHYDASSIASPVTNDVTI